MTPHSLTQVKVVMISQQLRQIEELWGEFLHIGDVALRGRQPCILDTVEHAVGKVKMTTLGNSKQQENLIISANAQT